MAYTRTLMTILPLAAVLCVQSNATKTRASEISTQHCSADEGCGTLRLLLVGKTGGGKSTVGNLILGEKIFGTSPSMSSETSKCQLERRERFGQMIEVMDSPGLFDTNGNKTAIAEIVMKSVAGMNPGAHAILYVFRIGNRYTEEEWDSYNSLKVYLGGNMVDHTIVLFTHGKNLQGMTIEDYLKTVTKNFTQVLKECGHRYVVFDEDEKKKRQVEILLEVVRKMVKQNGGKTFESPLTEAIRDAIKRILNEEKWTDMWLIKQMIVAGEKLLDWAGDVYISFYESVFGEDSYILSLKSKMPLDNMFAPFKWLYGKVFG